jgi:glycosyltransferase involved in cell wall biosynthesis
LLVSLLTGRPAIIIREEIGAMRRRVQDLLAIGGFDALHADQIPMAQYGLLGQGTGIGRLLDQHNVTFQLLDRLARHEPSLWKRAFLRREARAFGRYEAAVCRRFDHVTFVTSQDRQTLLARMGNGAQNGRSSVIPICIDTEESQPVSPVAAPVRVTCLGTMYWPPNVEGFAWFWENVWPQVRQRAPRARLTCIGKRPPQRIQALDGEPDVEILGYVPDLAPYLAETAVFIVPLRTAGGMRVKIVDAWCWGLPVVSTTIGAEGIAFREGESILIADSPQDFASAVLQVLTDREVGDRLRAAGRRWAEQRYDWRHIYGAWDEIYDRLLSGSNRHGPS